MIVTSVIGLIAFLWPFLLQKDSVFSNNSDNASILLLLIVPLVLMVALAEMMFAFARLILVDNNAKHLVKMVLII